MKVTLDSLQNLKNSNIAILIIKETNDKKVQVSGNDLNSAFQFNYHLTAVDLSGLDLSAVTDVAHIFEGCSSLRSVGNLSNWLISNVADLSYMFYATNNILPVKPKKCHKPSVFYIKIKMSSAKGTLVE